MNGIEIMEENETILLIIDMQEKLIKGIEKRKEIIGNIIKLVKATRVLNIETIISEQNSDRLGKTLENINTDKTYNVYNKMSFSCLDCDELLRQICSSNKKNVVISGIESHVCVLQTCINLISRGYRTYVVTDAIGSRNVQDHKIALKRLESEGAILTTAESTIFEWCKTADRKEFKVISSIIKEPLLVQYKPQSEAIDISI